MLKTPCNKCEWFDGYDCDHGVGIDARDSECEWFDREPDLLIKTKANYVKIGDLMNASRTNKPSWKPVQDIQPGVQRGGTDYTNFLFEKGDYVVLPKYCAVNIKEKQNDEDK